MQSYSNDSSSFATINYTNNHYAYVKQYKARIMTVNKIDWKKLLTST